jgi:hypothetical protein
MGDCGDDVERSFTRDELLTNVMPRGGHFAALEVPELLVQDIHEFFRPLRRST